MNRWQDADKTSPVDNRRAGQQSSGPVSAGDGGDAAQPVSGQSVEEKTVVDKPKSRRGVASWGIWMTVCVLIVAGPPLVHTFVPGWGILFFLLMVALTGGVVDAKAFWFTYSFPILIGVAYYLAMKMYFNSGTWIYLPVMVILAFIGAAIGDNKGATEAWKGED